MRPEQDIQHIVDCAFALSLMPSDIVLVIYYDGGVLSCKYVAEERLIYAAHYKDYVYHVRRPIDRGEAWDIIKMIPDYCYSYRAE